MTQTHGFELVWERDIPELKTHAQFWRHVKTGAELLSMQNDDENKVFGVTFRTPPHDSTGIAHIMEHSVLCGSRKYPLKEPFVELLKGSLKTFLNAMTYSDKTVYPVASQNLQDFYNLVDVYLDAVFYPRITPEILQQEGWHYELENAADPLVYKGVVFNEMKGAYSSPDSVLYRASQRSLFPDTTYGVDSGGDPRAIPDLTYEQFKQFHDTLYHPSNARLYFYGDDPPAERLRILDAYLNDFEQIAVDSNIALQKRFTEPKRIVQQYAAGDGAEGAKKSLVTINWLLGEPQDAQLSLGLGILEYILLGTPASPLRKALIDSGLGEDTAGGGLGEMRQAYFSTGMKGIAEADADKVEALVLDTLNDLATNGIDHGTIEAAINTVEFSLRENNTGSFPRGLALMIRSLDTWLYGEDPLAPLMYEAPLTAIKDALAKNEPYFENLLKQYWIGNTHRTTVVLQPDSGLSAREEAAEKARLDAARAAMSEADVEAVVESTRQLKLMQETPDTPEALATVPSLHLGDLDKQNKTIPLDVLDENGSKVLFHDLFTNGIVYLELGFDLHVLPQELLPYVPLFGRALFEMGTEREDFVQLAQRIGRTTGGIYATSLTSSLSGDQSSVAWQFLRGKATMAHVGDLLDILRDVLLTIKLDNKERFRQMVLKAKAGREAGLIPSGHSVVNLRMRAHFTESDWIDEQMGGISYLFFLRQLADQVDNDWPSVLASLERIKSLLINRNTLLCNVTLDAANYATVAPQLRALFAALPAAPVEPATWTTQRGRGFEGLTLPAQVNYVGKAANLYDLGYTYNGSIAVISRYIRTTWLWDRIRVLGGAYGAFSMFDRHSGVWSFLSYRDPNLLGTLANYDAASDFLRGLDLNADEVTKGIIGAIGDIDGYQLPDAKGYTSMVRYLVGDDDNRRQLIRDEILGTTAADFKNFADVLAQFNERALVTVLGSAQAIEAANNERGGNWLDIVKVM